jgi:hypothetical protein
MFTHFESLHCNFRQCYINLKGLNPNCHECFIHILKACVSCVCFRIVGKFIALVAELSKAVDYAELMNGFGENHTEGKSNPETGPEITNLGPEFPEKVRH